MEEQVVINAKVGSRTYKIKVSPTNENYVRETLAQIAAKLHSFKVGFPGLEEQDYLAMVLLDHVTGSAQPSSASPDMEQQLQRISDLLQS